MSLRVPLPCRPGLVLPAKKGRPPLAVPDLGCEAGGPVSPVHWWPFNDTPGGIPSGSPAVPADLGSAALPGNDSVSFAAGTFIGITTPSPVGAAFGNALGLSAAAGVFGLPSMVYPPDPPQLDFTVFDQGLTLDMWIGGNGGGLGGASVVRHIFGDVGTPELEVVVANIDLLDVNFRYDGGTAGSISVLVPGISATPKHVRVVLPPTPAGVVTVIPHDLPAATAAFTGGLDLLGVAAGLMQPSLLPDPFLASAAAIDEVALFNGRFPTPVGAAAVPTVPGVWPGIPA